MNRRLCTLSKPEPIVQGRGRGEERRGGNEVDKGKRGSKPEPIVQGRGRGEERMRGGDKGKRGSVCFIEFSIDKWPNLTVILVIPSSLLPSLSCVTS